MSKSSQVESEIAATAVKAILDLDGPRQMNEYISCLFITYNRSDLLAKTFEALKDGIANSGLVAEFVVSDDSSSPTHQIAISKLTFDAMAVAKCNSGLGANQNRGLALCKHQFILQVQDDMLFIGCPLELSASIELLKSDGEIGIVQLTPVHSDLPFERRMIGVHEFVIFVNDGLPWLRNCGVRPYSDLPHIKRREFVTDLGPYLEGVSMPDCENDYKRRVARQRKWKVAQLVSSGSFKHLGEDVSYNLGGKRHPLLRSISSLPVFGTKLEMGFRKIYIQIDHAAAVAWSFLQRR
jgi:glycosyltransferase involved in cell wall biosynthesis